MTHPQRIVFGTSLLFAPFLFALSSFFWTDEGQYGIVGGALLVFGSVFWIVGFTAIFRLLEDRTPRYASWGLLVAIYGAVCGGAAFAFQGLFTALYGISHEAALQALAAHPLVANAIFWIGGPAFPLSLLVLGIVLVRTGIVPLWVGVVLALGGVLFPVARIPRSDLIAHLVDALVLVPTWYIGQRMLRDRSFLR